MEERELLTFLLSVTVLLVALIQRRTLNLFSALRLPFIAFCLMTLSSLANLLDNTISFQFFSVAEHVLYTLSAAVIAYWIYRQEDSASS